MSEKPKQEGMEIALVMSDAFIERAGVRRGRYVLRSDAGAHVRIIELESSGSQWGWVKIASG